MPEVDYNTQVGTIFYISWLPLRLRGIEELCSYAIALATCNICAMILPVACHLSEQSYLAIVDYHNHQPQKLEAAAALASSGMIPPFTEF